MSKLKDTYEKKKSEREKDEKVGMGRRLNDLADDFIDTHESKLVAAEGEDDDSVSLYKKSEDNVIAPYPDKRLESDIFAQNPELLAKNTKELMRLIKHKLYRTAQLDLTTVQPVAFADEPNVLTWNRLTLRRTELGKRNLDSLKAFGHILSLCDDQQALVLWIGSLLDPNAGRSQYLHLHGGGGNGKSTLFSGISRVLGQRYVVTSRADEFANQHWGSALEGARLLIFPDENNPGFFSTGKFKELTGEDFTSINPKYEKPRRIRLTHKTAVFSNNRVEISSNAADRRRLITISMKDDPDPNVGYRWWYEELKKGGADILAYCFGEYEKAVAADPSVRAYIPQRAEIAEAAISRKYADLTEVISDLFTVTGLSENSLPAATVHDAILDRMKERRSNRIFMQQLREALRHLGARVDGGLYRGIKNKSGLSIVTLPKV